MCIFFLRSIISGHVTILSFFPLSVAHHWKDFSLIKQPRIAWISNSMKGKENTKALLKAYNHLSPSPFLLTPLFCRATVSGMCGMSVNSILCNVKWHPATKSTREHWPIVPPEGFYLLSVVDSATISHFSYFHSSLSCFYGWFIFFFVCVSKSDTLRLKKKGVTKTNLCFAVVIMTAWQLFPAFWNSTVRREGVSKLAY